MLLTAMPTNTMMEEHHIHSALSLSVPQVREECPLSAFTLSPECVGCKPEMQMMYAGSKLGVVKDCGFTKVIVYHSLSVCPEGLSYCGCRFLSCDLQKT